MTAFVVGLVLALAVAGFARVARMDRDRAFYPTVLSVVASYYALFAVMGGATQVLLVECAVAALFLLAVLLGSRRNLWIVAAGLLAHGLQDLVHGHVIHNPGMPAWWPMFCGGYDVMAAACLAWLLWHGTPPARRTDAS